MDAFSTRQEAGNARGASEIYRAHLPTAGNRRAFKRILQHYADLVICPRLAQHLSREALDAQRLVAAQRVIRAAPGIAMDLAQMAKSAPRELPFRFTALDSFRIQLDQLHSLERAPRLEVGA
ncbi:hypothetical protein D9M70_392060 [compost metagenome]